VTIGLFACWKKIECKSQNKNYRRLNNNWHYECRPVDKTSEIISELKSVYEKLLLLARKNIIFIQQVGQKHIYNSSKYLTQGYM